MHMNTVGTITERQKMNQEKENARQRQYRMDQVTAKVKAGQIRKQRRQQEEELDRLHNLRYYVRLRNRQRNSAVTVQRHYRGCIGRRAAGLWRERKLRMQARHAFYLACSTTISRYWRGYKGRQEAKELRRKMAEFIMTLRQIDLNEEQREATRKKEKRWWHFLL